MPNIDPRLDQRASLEGGGSMRSSGGSGLARIVAPIVWMLVGASLATGTLWALDSSPRRAIAKLTAGKVKVETIKPGSGARPTLTDMVLINYKGMLPDGKVFDQNQNVPMPLDGVIPGFTQALTEMQRGGSYKVFIPAELAYGEKGAGPIPPNTDLTFEIDLIDFRSRQEVEAEMQKMQQLQQQQQQLNPSPAPPTPARP
jgi:FKBP-type peptidyl-prolyl cis-trans isomerase FkpA